MAAKGVLIGCLLIACWVAVSSYPTVLHASCKITWTFKVPCTTVNGLIIKQMKLWNIDFPCGSSEKCGYAIKSASNTSVTGTHRTPVKHYLDDLTMGFSTSNTTCSVKAFSTSETWYAVLDYGTNYCNLHNLVNGSGLTNTTRYGFKEDTSDSVCTQYTSRNCSKY